MKTARYGIIALSLLLTDQVIKALIAAKDPFIDLGVADIHYVQNTGAIWGILQSNNTLFIWLSIIAIGTLMLTYNKFEKDSPAWIIIIGAGIMGNLIDRVMHGHVIDYIDLRFWPVFNISDAMIVIGVSATLIMSVFWQRKPSQHAS